MKKKKLLILAVSILAVILAVMIIVFSFGGEKDFMKNEQTVGFISDAIRAMSDSRFSDFDLASRIYTHAFTDNAKIKDTFGDTAEDAIQKINEQTATEDLLNSIVFYGGKSADIKGIEVAKREAVDFDDLYVGDLLIFKSTDGSFLYIKDKESLVNLAKATETVDEDKVYEQIESCDLFVVCRPMKIMENYTFITEEPEDLDLTKEQEALIATAESYLLRGDKLQYADTRLGSGYDTEFRWLPGMNTPEDNTLDKMGFTNCAAFTYDVYFHALGYDLEYQGHKLYTTANLAKYSEAAGICAYDMICKTSDEYTDEEKEQIKADIYSILQPADILVVRRSNGNGHAMLYTGNGNIIHSGGSVYNVGEAKEVYEATVRRMRFEDYFFNETKNGYIFGKDVASKVLSFTIVRPLLKWEGEITDQTKNRVENLQGVVAQKNASHNVALTVNRGEEITYKYEIYNTNDYEVTLEIEEEIPENTTYISGAETVSGDKLLWEVDIPANTRKKFEYKVRVNQDAEYGSVINGTTGAVGGVPTRCADITVNRTLKADEQTKLVNTFKSFENTDLKGLELVNHLYSKALGSENVFGTTDFDFVLRGGNGVFFCNPEYYNVSGSVYHTVNDDGIYLDMLAPTLYGGRSLKGTQWTKRTRLAQPHHLAIGDVLMRKTSEEKQIFIFLGEDKFYRIDEGIKSDTLDVKRRLESCLATANCYAVLRPSFAIK